MFQINKSMSKNTEVGRRLAYLQKEKGSYIAFLCRCGFDAGLKIKKQTNKQKKKKKKTPKSFTQEDKFNWQYNKICNFKLIATLISLVLISAIKSLNFSLA